MSERDFVYWLQGFFEMTDVTVLTEKQVKMVKEHLGYVFLHPGTIAGTIRGGSPTDTTIQGGSSGTVLLSPAGQIPVGQGATASLAGFLKSGPDMGTAIC